MKTSESLRGEKERERERDRERKRERERGGVELGVKGRKKQRETEDEIV